MKIMGSDGDDSSSSGFGTDGSDHQESSANKLPSSKKEFKIGSSPTKRKNTLNMSRGRTSFILDPSPLPKAKDDD
jgi:hypothetical protein